jgi:hypothetical protein
MTITKNLTIDQGATFVANLTAISDTNQIIDLSTYGLSGKLQKTFQSANLTSVFNSSFFGNPINGNIQLTLTSGDTANIAPGRYVYSLFGQSNNFVLKLYEGTVTVNPSALAIGVGKEYSGSIHLAIPPYLLSYISNVTTEQNNFFANSLYEVYFLNNTYFQSFATTLQGFGNIINTLSGNIITLNSITTTLQSNVANITSSISNVITLSTLKSIVATSNSWSEFQANIALL